MKTAELVKEICAGAVEYASVADRSSRMSVRARILGRIDKLQLDKAGVSVRVVGEDELRTSVGLRGGLIMHLDLASRSALTSSELIFTAATGKVLIAEHKDMPGFPVGVCLMLPSATLVKGRRALFTDKSQGWGASEFIMIYALATNPGGLGAGGALIAEARRQAGSARLIAYSPLTGLRARIIQVVDDPATWKSATANLGDDEGATLERQLTDLLARDTLPDFIDEPAASFLASEARSFAASDRYRVGQFHVHLGATLLDIDDASDPSDCDSMWTRAYFEYL